MSVFSVSHLWPVLPPCYRLHNIFTHKWHFGKCSLCASLEQRSAQRKQKVVIFGRALLCMQCIFNACYVKTAPCWRQTVHFTRVAARFKSITYEVVFQWGCFHRQHSRSSLGFGSKHCVSFIIAWLHDPTSTHRALFFKFNKAKTLITGEQVNNNFHKTSLI